MDFPHLPTVPVERVVCHLAISQIGNKIRLESDTGPPGNIKG
jgi:hypothetical protein